MTRREVLEEAALKCMKELYTKVQPAVDWDDFMEENRLYSKAYKQWESLYKKSPEKAGSVLDFCGPKPYEFYYLPRKVFKEIADSYVDAYCIDSKQNLLDIIDILKNYCKDPIIDKYIDKYVDITGNPHPGYRSYEHPDNLEKELTTLIKMYCDDSEADFIGVAKEMQSKFFEFLDMAGKFFNWNRDLNTFNTTVYLGPSPCSNKETVIKNWKIYRNKDITIDESIYIEED